ncbi:MAG: hypothetical protein Q9M89_06485 [Persephonella sp.]|nr:hypothetical protein [Persephonella sp.]
MEIAEKCNVEIETAETKRISFPKIPDTKDWIEKQQKKKKPSITEKLSWEGLEKRTFQE